MMRRTLMIGLLAVAPCMALPVMACAQEQSLTPPPLPPTATLGKSPDAGLQPGGDPDRNVRLRIELDRTRIKGYEPVYIGATADQFAVNLRPHVSLQRDGGAWVDLDISERDWDKRFASYVVPSAPVMKTGLLLAMTPPDGNGYLFAQSGTYKLRVSLGPDSTTLTLVVEPPELGDVRSFPLVAEVFPKFFTEPLNAPTDERVIRACESVLKQYPASRCGDYCRGYLAALRFRETFQVKGRKGGRGVYGNVAEQLERALSAFPGHFYGEQLSFYAMYARGLCAEYPTVLKIADGMRTHVTPWSQNIEAMQLEVIKHTQPQVVPKEVDLGAPLPAPATSQKSE